MNISYQLSKQSSNKKARTVLLHCNPGSEAADTMAKRSGVSLGVLALAAAGAAASLLSDCADSTSWYYEDRAKTCEAYVSKKSKNCKKKDEFKVGRSALARRQKLVTVAHRRSRAKTPAR